MFSAVQLLYNRLFPKIQTLFLCVCVCGEWDMNWQSSYILKELEIAQEECSLVSLIWIPIWIQPHQDAFLCNCVINMHISSETHHSCLCPYSESFQFEHKFTNSVFLEIKVLFTWGM